MNTLAAKTKIRAMNIPDKAKKKKPWIAQIIIFGSSTTPSMATKRICAKVFKKGMAQATPRAASIATTFITVADADPKKTLIVILTKDSSIKTVL